MKLALVDHVELTVIYGFSDCFTGGVFFCQKSMREEIYQGISKDPIERSMLLVYE
jgi:hypothetical protein